MEFFTNLLESMDGNIIEYCILGGIIVLVIVLIFSIISCIKSLGNKEPKRKYAKLELDDIEDDSIEKDNVAELIREAEKEKTVSKVEEIPVKEEVKIAEKIEIPEIIEETVEEVEQKPVTQKLDIRSITREMELRLEEEALETIDIDSYEDEQEKTAIISYKELVAAAAKIEANADKEEDYLDEDVVFEFNSKKIMSEEIETPKFASKKFKPTVDISPVFGAKIHATNEQEDLLKIEEIDQESSTEEQENFLKNLQNFRSNLD